MRYGGLADPTEPQRSERDSKLGGAQVGVQVSLEALDDPGPPLTLISEFLNPSAANLDQRELRRHEEPAEKHESNRRQQEKNLLSHVRPVEADVGGDKMLLAPTTKL